MARVVNVGTDALGSGSFDPAPAGTKVKAVIFEVEETTVKSQSSPNYGQPQIVVTAKITSDFKFQGADGTTQNLKGREVRYNNVPLYAGKAPWQLAQFAEAVGWGVDDDGNIQIPDEGEVAVNTQGREVVVTLGIRTSQDGSKKFQSVSRWAPANAKVSDNAGGASGGAAPAGGGNIWN